MDLLSVSLHLFFSGLGNLAAYLAAHVLSVYYPLFI